MVDRYRERYKERGGEIQREREVDRYRERYKERGGEIQRERGR